MASRKKASAVKADPKQLGYNATESKGRREAPKTRLWSEDKELTSANRKKLWSTARDMYRNMSLLAWMIRRHVDYVSRFTPFCNSGDVEVDRQVMRLLKRASRKENFDVAGRHDRSRMMRLFELSKVIDGDCLFLKTSDGKIQAIEADRIARPGDYEKTVSERYRKRLTEEGLVLDEYGRVEKYCICGRGEDKKSKVFERLVDASDVIYDGYFFRFDQTRGISPLSSAMNTLRDLYESHEWTLLKIKLHALFGLAIHREVAAANNGLINTGASGSDNTTDASGTTTTTTQNTYDVSMQKSVLMLDLDPGDKVDTIESKTPNSQFIEYSGLMIRIALLALDIPYTAFDSMKSSFSARIADRNEYEVSAASKREANRSVLEAYAEWKLRYWAEWDERLKTAMAAAKIDFEQLLNSIKWIPSGTPWMDKLAEIQGSIKSVSLGVESRQMVCAQRGISFEDVMAQQKYELDLMESLGIPTVIGDSGQEIINKDTSDEQAN